MQIDTEKFQRDIEADVKIIQESIQKWKKGIAGEIGEENTRLRAALDAADARAQDATLDALAAQGQAAEAHEARLKAEAERDAARAKALDALAAEYILTPPLYNGDMQNGRRDAVRGVAVRLGVYEGLDDAIDAAIRAMKEPTK